MRQYRLVAEYSNESIDLNCFGNFAFQPTRREFSRNVQLLDNNNYNFIENGVDPTPTEFFGQIVFKGDSLQSAITRCETFKKFFAKNTFKDYVNYQFYCFGNEPKDYYWSGWHDSSKWLIDLPQMTQNLVRKVRLISRHENGEERFAYVYLKQMQNIRRNSSGYVSADVTFGLLSLWQKKIEFDLGGDTFGNYKNFTLEEFGDTDEVVIGAEFTPNNFKDDDTFTLKGKTELTICFSQDTKREYQVRESPSQDPFYIYYTKGAKTFVGEYLNQYCIVLEAGEFFRSMNEGEASISNLQPTYFNGYQFLDHSKLSKVTADQMHPIISLESSRNMLTIPDAKARYVGIDGKLFYYVKYFED